jgi:hypothetical protein
LVTTLPVKVVINKTEFKIVVKQFLINFSAAVLGKIQNAVSCGWHHGNNSFWCFLLTYLFQRNLNGYSFSDLMTKREKNIIGIWGIRVAGIRKVKGSQGKKLSSVLRYGHCSSLDMLGDS